MSTRAYTRRGFVQLSAAALGVVATGLLAACSGAPAASPTAAPAPTQPPAPSPTTAAPTAAAGSAPTPTAAQAATQATKTIRVWERVDPGYAEMFKETIPLFQAKNPAIKIQYVPSDEEFDKLTASMVAGDAPEVFTTYDQYTRQFVATDQLRPLDDYVKRDLTPEQRADWYPDTVKFMTFKGSLMVAPADASTVVLAYNPDVFDKAGVAYPDGTWDWTGKFLEQAKKLTKTGEQWAFQSRVGTGSNFKHHGPFVWAWGGEIVDPANPIKLAIDQPPSLAAYDWLRALLWEQKVHPTPQDTKDNMRTNFAAGKIAMYTEGSWGITRVLPGLKKDKRRFQVAPLPKGPVRQATTHEDDGYAIWKGSKDPDAAWTVDRWLIGTDHIRIQTRLIGLQPALKSMEKEWLNLFQQGYPEETKDMNLQAYLDAWSYARGDHTLCSSRALDALVPAFDQIIPLGKTDAKTAFAQVVPQANTILAEDCPKITGGVGFCSCAV
jgi:multiple sugar transport system substrate-binding protein